jgi:hypothetical protein
MKLTWRSIAKNKPVTGHSTTMWSADISPCLDSNIATSFQTVRQRFWLLKRKDRSIICRRQINIWLTIPLSVRSFCSNVSYMDHLKSKRIKKEKNKETKLNQTRPSGMRCRVVPLKRWHVSTKLYGITFQTATFIIIALRTLKRISNKQNCNCTCLTFMWDMVTVREKHILKEVEKSLLNIWNERNNQRRKLNNHKLQNMHSSINI